MAQKRRRSNVGQSLGRIGLALLSFVIVVVIAFGSIFLIENFTDIKSNGDSPSSKAESVSSVESVDDLSAEVTKVATATVAATGDLLMHVPVINSAKTDDGYNFDNIFTYFSNYTSKADYAVANLETTLRGTEDGYKYSGYPNFNCPDEIVNATKSAGFDMLLTANNHSYDTYLNGMLRTLEVIDASGLDRIGTYKTVDEKKYLVKDINGIKVGMLCYTYETDSSETGVALNGIALNNEAKGLVNAFSYSELDKFYQTVGTQMESMKQEGAEAYVMFIHWGEEYELKENENQRKIAQQLCNMNIDVIVGGHSHVVQPIELLTSERNENRKTVCLYSMGNAVSNQRKEIMTGTAPYGHSEDGVLFMFTFAKYSDGKVLLEYADVLPTWVNMFTSNGKKVYQILPLDKSVEDWKAAFDLTDTSLKNAEKSYERTEKIVGEGLKEVQDYLNSEANAYPKQELATESVIDNTSSTVSVE